jgi:hypothetical protein
MVELAATSASRTCSAEDSQRGGTGSLVLRGDGDSKSVKLPRMTNSAPMLGSKRMTLLTETTCRGGSLLFDGDAGLWGAPARWSVLVGKPG